jgi:oligoendopeptidase F
MFTEFTADHIEASQWDWDDWKPYFDELEAAELTADDMEEWLQKQTVVSKMLQEIGNRLWVATTVDTNDEAAAAAFKRFRRDISPNSDKAFHTLNTKLVESDLVPDSMRIPLRNLKALIRIFNEDNLPLITEENELGQAYNRIVGAQTVEWEGEAVPLGQLAPVQEDLARKRRKQAWLLEQERKKQDREAHDALWRQYMELRGQLAKNAGFDNYRQYIWLSSFRHDYTPEDALQFAEAILQVVVPVQERLHEGRRERLGYETLRPWDLRVDPAGRAPLRPYTDINDFIDKTEAIFHYVDPELGANFTTMKTENLLDLENRVGKGPGGYNTHFPVSERPFIFMNAVNVESDVITILHEAGHAFHAFAKGNLTYIPQMWVPMEFSEVASMAMELLASPYLSNAHGGYFTEAEAARFRANHMRAIINLWTFIATGVAFQHWVYINHEVATDPANCDARWLELWGQYRRGVDWSGYEDFILNGWRSLPHFFQTPFYMVEYGLAQLGAVQIYANALQDQASALKKYREALALGGTVTLPELYEAAGAKLAFDAETLKVAVDLLDSQIKRFDAPQN